MLSDSSPIPFRLEDILSYIDSLSAGDSAAKTAVDIALHDLVGKIVAGPWYKIWGLDKGESAFYHLYHRYYTPDVVREKTKSVPAVQYPEGEAGARQR